MFRNYHAPFELMDHLVDELNAEKSQKSNPDNYDNNTDAHHQLNEEKETGSSSFGNRPRLSSVSRGVGAVVAKSKRRQQQASTVARTANPLLSELPSTKILHPIIADLFGETIRRAKEEEKDDDLYESILALLSSFTQRYVFNSQFFAHVPMDQHVRQITACYF